MLVLRRFLVTIAVVAYAAVAVVAATAAHTTSLAGPSVSNPVRFCVNNEGDVTVIAGEKTHCRDNETEVDFFKAGTGPSGPSGPSGPQGASGLQGHDTQKM